MRSRGSPLSTGEYKKTQKPLTSLGLPDQTELFITRIIGIVLVQHSRSAPKSQEEKLFEKRSGAQFAVSTICPRMLLEILQSAKWEGSFPLGARLISGVIKSAISRVTMLKVVARFLVRRAKLH